VVRVLFLPSHVGLGHAARDVVIAGILRGLEPRVSIEWCTAEPALGFLERLGERVAPGCAGLESFSKPIEDLYNGRIGGLRELASSLSILRRNYSIVSRMLDRYDLVFADEYWDVVYGVPDEVRRGIVFATDILYKPYTGGPRSLLLSLILNRYFRRILPRYRRLIYLNDPSILEGRRWYPLVGGSLGRWLEGHAYIAGLATSYAPGSLPGRLEARRRLGVGEDDFLVVAAVGGTSAASKSLLDCAERAAPALRELASQRGAGLRIIALPGPRTGWTPSTSLVEVPEDPSPPGLQDYYAAADLFISRAGRTTTADLLCAGIPAVLIPIPGHFEQEDIASHMSARYGYQVLGEPECSPEKLLAAARRILSSGPRRPPPGLCEGSRRAALLLQDLLRAPGLEPPQD